MLSTQSQLIRVPERISTLFEDSATVQEFEQILKGGTNSFIKSALLCIAASPDLMNCTPQSLASGALRSATLGLSLDPALRQAWLVPRPIKGIWTACFQPHYAGLYDLAIRTNIYRYISVMPIHQGERVLQDPQTGIHYFCLEGKDILFSAVQGEGGLKAENMRDVTNGKPIKPVIGYLGYFKTRSGFEKSVWMTLAEIQAHALLWSPASYNSSKGAWQSKAKRPIMEMKTVFIALSKFMDLSSGSAQNLKQALDDNAFTEEEAPIDVTPEPVYESIPPQPEIVYEDFPEGAPAPVTELHIESKAHAPLRKLEVVTDQAWESLMRWVEKANKAGIVTRKYEREHMTATLVNGAAQYLQQELAKAEKK